MLSTIFLSFFLLFQTSPNATAQPQQTPSPRPSPMPITQMLDEPTSVTKHSIRAGGRQLNYTATSGFMPIRNAQTGETEAKIFYMAYILDGTTNRKNRPLMFSFNGGPRLVKRLASPRRARSETRQNARRRFDAAAAIRTRGQRADVADGNGFGFY
jgi:hypothetical protein